MMRTATLVALTSLVAAGCGKRDATPPPPQRVQGDDAIASVAVPAPATEIAPVTMAPPRRTVGHPIPKDYVKNTLPASPDAGATQVAPVAAAEGHAGHGHDPDHPPIDCPLAEAGVDAHHMKPFEDVAKYIAHLERPDRAAWQKPDEVVAALALLGDETVYDVGAGGGYFSFRFAKALPRGKVVAADTEPEMVRHVHHKAMTEKIENVTAKVIGVDDPGVTADVDLVFVCDVLHHVQDRPAWMRKLADEMKPEARLVIIEFREGDLPVGPPEEMKIGRAEVLKLATGAGLRMVSEDGDLLPYQRLFVFEKP